MNVELKPFNAALSTTLFTGRCTLATYQEGPKVRGKKTPVVLANYCPFCGTKYEAKP